MAVFFLNLKTFGRSGGSSAPGAAAYRAGERIRDERTGRVHDHTGRTDVMYKEIIVPRRFADSDLDWAKTRALLWNAAEEAETRKNARVAREYLVALPAELTPEQRTNLARGFSQELSDRYGFAVDLTIHAPRDYPDSDPRNFHAHLLATTREVAISGLSVKTTLEMNDAARRQMGLGPAITEIFHIKERWAAATNQALEKAQLAVRVDHRSLELQGIDREPRPHIPKVAFEMERQGYRSEVAERLREQYEARVRARLERNVTLSAAAPPDRSATATTAKPQSLEEIRRQAREDWLRLREEMSAQAADRQRAKSAARDPAARDPGAEDDHAYEDGLHR